MAAFVPLLVRVHEVGENPPAAPPLENMTVPLGFVGVAEVSVTVAEHEVAVPTVTDAGVQFTTVVVASRVPATTLTLNWAGLALASPVVVALVVIVGVLPGARVVFNEIWVVPLPPAATGTDVGLKLTVTPLTGIEVSVTVPANPFILVTVPVRSAVGGAPDTALTKLAERVQVKSVTLTNTLIGACRVLFWRVVQLLAI